MSALQNNIMLLEIVKVALFCGAFYLSGSYLIPKGIICFYEWKQHKKKNDLCNGVMFFSTGFMLLAYLLATVIISHVRNLS
ncbi:MAG: hypothetical protein V4487_01725 [Chlamydiota bacterium]